MWLSLFWVGLVLSAACVSAQTLREVVEDRFPEGNVFMGANFQPLEWRDYINHFNLVTAGSYFKQLKIHPDNDTWDWESTDGYVEWALNNDAIVYMHSPISPQCSEWAKGDDRTPEELLQNMSEFVPAIAERYSPYASYMEVVNETVHDSTGEWTGPKPGIEDWENPWLAIGFDPDGIPTYIRTAFELSNQYASPDVKLGWNHNGGLNLIAWEKIITTIEILKSEGLRIDYIGYQAHVGIEGHNLQDVEEWASNLNSLIDYCHQNNMEFFITELDVFIQEPYWFGFWPSQDQLNIQKEYYKGIIELVLSHADNGTVGISFWSLSDDESWRWYWWPGLLDSSYNLKPSGYGVFEAFSGN